MLQCSYISEFSNKNIYKIIMSNQNTLPLISIITVNYNQSRVTCDLLASLRDVTYSNIEILVVDNGSPDDDPESMKKQFPEIKLIISKDNLGFAGGNNLAVLESQGDYLLFINNDTEVQPDFLEPMVELFQTNEHIGMVSPKIRFHHTPDTIQYAGYTPMHPITFRQYLVGYRQVDKGQFEQTMETYSVHGAAMMIPRKVIQEVGMMADLFFLYYEEHDWVGRIKRAGYKAFYQPKSLVYHKESISTGKESPLKTYYLTRNRILFARRNSKPSVLWLNYLYFAFIMIPKNSLQYLVKGKFKLLSSFWRGVLWNLSHFRGLKKNATLEL